MARVRASKTGALVSAAPRIFVERACAAGERIELDRAEARHLALVLRMKPGERIAIASDGVLWSAELAHIDHTTFEATATVLGRSDEASTEPPVQVSVLQAVPKGAKMDDVVEKTVELGAARIVPVRCARSYGGDSALKLERWRRIARAAAQQSRRLVVPQVGDPLPFADAIARYASTTHVIVAHEGAPRGSLASALEKSAQRAISICIGPEGSFTDDELARAKTTGCDFASLGPTIVRTETAAAAMLAAIAALRGWM